MTPSRMPSAISVSLRAGNLALDNSVQRNRGLIAGAQALADIYEKTVLAKNSTTFSILGVREEEREPLRREEHEVRYHHQTRSLGRADRLPDPASRSGWVPVGWIFDSHVLWMEPYPLLTLMANATRKMRLGPCVTDPAVRDLTVTASLFATLNLISGGRMELGNRAWR